MDIVKHAEVRKVEHLDITVKHTPLLDDKWRLDCGSALDVQFTGHFASECSVSDSDVSPVFTLKDQSGCAVCGKWAFFECNVGRSDSQ